ncbi:MAG: ferritin-like domain-containing protein [Capsulimonadaceae bacterium]|nr:ferritin-like domain-containing protein [Capsulimonadaceae bacterium]
MNDLRELFVMELKDLYSAEQQILRSLPLLTRAAFDPALKATFEEHIQQTEAHVRRLEQILDDLGEKPIGKFCKGMQGLVEEENEVLNETDATPGVRDAALISAVQRVEHYEIAGYGCARTFAERLGENEAAEMLQQTLNEAGETDKKLTQIAQWPVNESAKTRRI